MCPDGNWTHDLSAYGQCSNQVSHTGQGLVKYFWDDTLTLCCRSRGRCLYVTVLHSLCVNYHFIYSVILFHSYQVLYQRCRYNLEDNRQNPFLCGSYLSTDDTFLTKIFSILNSMKYVLTFWELKIFGKAKFLIKLALQPWQITYMSVFCKWFFWDRNL